MVNLISSISRETGRLSAWQVFEKNPCLRRNNRICSIHSSLVIENNPLTPSEVTGRSRSTITRTISSLKEKGILGREGSDKKGYWVLKKEGIQW